MVSRKTWIGRNFAARKPRLLSALAVVKPRRSCPAFVVCLLVAAALPPAPAVADRSKIIHRSLSFAVENTNRSRVSCPSDGARYRVAGHLVAPRSALRRRHPAVTLYLHGFGFGEFYWRFRAVPGYNYARRMARMGQASVVIDRLGYDASGHPQGQLTCGGSQADVAHQVIGQLRSGNYAAPGRAGWTFDRVALAGHSFGSQVAEIEAYSFDDIDALIITAWSDENASPLALATLLRTGLVCATGGEPAEQEGDPSGYAYFGQSDADFRSAMFNDADAAVVAAATAARNRDPCGQFSAIVPGNISNNSNLDEVEVPVLIVCGTEDALFPTVACGRQAKFGDNSDVTTIFLKGSGHALTLEPQSQTLQRRVDAWLESRGF